MPDVVLNTLPLLPLNVIVGVLTETDQFIPLSEPIAPMNIRGDLDIPTLKNKNYTIKQTINHIYIKNGLNGFYDGILPRIFGIIPMRLIYWTSMHITNNNINSTIIAVTITGFIQSIIDNPIEVAKIVANEIGLGATSIACALLHDVIEDSEYTYEDIKKIFGEKKSFHIRV